MSVPIIDSKHWKPCGNWSENLTNTTKYLLQNKSGEPIWKPSFNPFANALPSYELDFSTECAFNYINGKDPWGRPFVKSIFYFKDNPHKPQRTALWRVLCGSGVKSYVEHTYNKSKVYKKFKLLGFTSINKEVVRLRISNITSDSLDKMAVKFRETGNFLEWKPANFVDKDVDDKRPAPMWII